MRPPPIKLAAALALLLLFAVIFFNRRSLFQLEPVHAGKPLTYWVEQWNSNRWAAPSAEQPWQHRLQAEEALLGMKNEVIPYLLDMLRTPQPKEPQWKWQLRRTIPKQWHRLLGLTSRDSQSIAATGLAALGTNAAPALPTLMATVRSSMSPTGTYTTASMWSMHALLPLGPAAEPALPMLIECLTNKNTVLAKDAANRLGELRLKPAVVVPALIAFLEGPASDSSSSTREAAIDTLFLYRKHAAIAAPTVRPFLNDPALNVRRSATNYFNYIQLQTPPK